ncbi:MULTISPECIES: hypothetical protein [unclassified Sphingopyxis]|jgi:hypothetical protein|uniref:hypothetical protein n=1 Tax=unclassified Sphingopyxis TaxID=2614943 RepID=UPI0007303E7E|nr:MULTISPECIES: hypothetical protein [unclassified Sphingopyxis]MBD3731218.1 hypothetical protein [Sphingopyxis sp.]KTE28147.1 hypothetical protein ATE61_02195 [Sphingopyxis sp. H057]KTE55473.1 hypothetical protein ATE64_00720 [Sphingopyxis sp. H073]KTE57640.1 hypothetical protein ATE69_02195 [Sphingopyxis sp. H071]KTE61127.1 hypothetical protein ATE66_06670 [Sphingopyxis sp. H107]
MRFAILPLVAATLMLAGCATPEARLRTGLNNAGLSKAMSACMAERMVDRLSLVQLRRLSALGSLKEKRLGDLSFDQFLHKVRALKDPEILTVTTSSAALCALR